MLSEFIGWPSQHSCMNIQSASPALQAVIDVSCELFLQMSIHSVSLCVCVCLSVCLCVGHTGVLYKNG